MQRCVDYGTDLFVMMQERTTKVALQRNGDMRTTRAEGSTKGKRDGHLAKNSSKKDNGGRAHIQLIIQSRAGHWQGKKRIENSSIDIVPN